MLVIILTEYFVTLKVLVFALKVLLFTLKATHFDLSYLPRHTAAVPMESFQELQEELCLLKTQVEILHDEVRQLKRKVKVNYNFYGIEYH